MSRHVSCVSRKARCSSASRILALVVAAATIFVAGCGKKKEEPTYGDNLARAIREGKASGARGDLQALAIAITNYTTNEGGIPGASNIDELAALLEPRYLRSMKRTDPWETPYTYSQDGTSYRLGSAGADRIHGTEDDMEMIDGQVTKMPKSYERFGP